MYNRNIQTSTNPRSIAEVFNLIKQNPSGLLSAQVMYEWGMLSHSEFIAMRKKYLSQRMAGVK